MTRNGNLMPRVFLGSAGHVMKVVLTLVPTISKTRDWISLSVILLMCPLRTYRRRRNKSIEDETSQRDPVVNRPSYPRSVMVYYRYCRVSRGTRFEMYSWTYLTEKKAEQVIRMQTVRVSDKQGRHRYLNHLETHIHIHTIDRQRRRVDEYLLLFRLSFYSNMAEWLPSYRFELISNRLDQSLEKDIDSSKQRSSFGSIRLSKMNFFTLGNRGQQLACTARLGEIRLFDLLKRPSQVKQGLPTQRYALRVRETVFRHSKRYFVPREASQPLGANPDSSRFCSSNSVSLFICYRKVHFFKEGRILLQNRDYAKKQLSMVDLITEVSYFSTHVGVSGPKFHVSGWP